MFPIKIKCRECGSTIKVSSYSNYVTCSICNKRIPFEGYLYTETEWTTIKDRILHEFQLAYISFMTWINPLERPYFYTDTAYICTPPNADPLMVNYLNNRYAAIFSVTITTDLGSEITVRFCHDTEKP